MAAWVRVRDKDTGHEYDLSARDSRVKHGVVEVLNDYPPNTGRSPRPAKHRTTKTGNRRRTTLTAEPSAPDTQENKTHG